MRTAILTSYFSKKKHPNDPRDPSVTGRLPSGFIENNASNYIDEWYNSVTKLDLEGYIFHDNLSVEFQNTYKNNKIKFIKVNDSHWSNLDYRWFCYQDFLKNNTFDYVFMTDCSDVVVVQDPTKLQDDFPDADFFLCQDSLMLNEFPYLQFHQRFNLNDSVWFMLNQNQLALINMGVIGGNHNNITLFLETYNKFRQSLKHPEFAQADMYVGQYVFRRLLSEKKIILGEPVCSEFKKYQTDRKDVYFIHK